MSNTETGTAAQCDFCDQQATAIVKLDTFARNVQYGLEYLVCDDCIADAECNMEEQGYHSSEYYTVENAWA